MKTSEQLNELFDAMAQVQGALKDPGKEKTAKVSLKAGGDYSYKYADLSDILKIARPILAKNGISIIQSPTNEHAGAVTIITRLGHRSGQWIESALTLPVGDAKPQTLGSAITYGRRYAAAAILGLSPEEDDDAGLAQQAMPDKKEPRNVAQTLRAAIQNPPPPTADKLAAVRRFDRITAAAADRGIDVMAVLGMDYTTAVHESANFLEAACDKLEGMK